MLALSNVLYDDEKLFLSSCCCHSGFITHDKLARVNTFIIFW